MVMDLQIEINLIHKEIDEVRDPNLILSIKNIVEKRKAISSERINVKQYNMEIDASINQIHEEATLTHKKVGEHIRQWSEK